MTVMEKAFELQPAIERIGRFVRECECFPGLEADRDSLGAVVTQVEQLHANLGTPLRILLVGGTGVGKSSLLNAIDPGFHLKVGEVSRHGEGRHTTTWVELLPVAGGFVADTPGLEFFTLWGVSAGNLKDHFLEFVDLASGCRYRDCSHVSEAG